ncbi:hypothetical protein MBTS_05350 [Methylobacterium bullatum]|nr:hypothetical protein [Methylobacterium bullatum]
MENDQSAASRRTQSRSPARHDHPSRPPHPEVPERSGGLEGALQFARLVLEASFEAAPRHLRMRSSLGRTS